MATPTRPSRQAAFADEEGAIEDSREKTSDLLSRLGPRKPDSVRLQSVPPVPTAPPPALPVQSTPAAGDGDGVAHIGERAVAQGGSAAPGQAGSAGSSQAEQPAAASIGDRRGQRADKGAGAPRPADAARRKPPAAWISSVVYTRLVEFSDAEKRDRRSAARPFGVIVMDAIEKHADRLSTLWKGAGIDSPAPGQLFVRERHSRYRRHDLPPRSITLQGVGPENGKLLKRLQKQWGAGSVSDLVEQALRLELNI